MTPVAARGLIVNADDFGRAPGVNRGILQAHQMGIVSSTTLMVNLPWAAAAVALANDAPRLGIGLHLNFSYGPPLGDDVPSLRGADGLLNRNLAQLRERATAADIEREARAQLTRFTALTGHAPTHVDAHLHAHSWPRFQEVIVTLASERRLPLRPATPALAATVRAAGLSAPDAFINDFFAPGSMTHSGLLRALTSLPPGVSELMCHPGIADAALADSSFNTQREDELALLCAPDVRAALTRHGVTLMTYAELP